MMNEIFGLVREYASDVITKNPDIPDDKKEIAVDTTTDAVKDGLKKYLNPSNISSLANMLSDNRATSNDIVLNTLQEDVVNSLSNKVGLDSKVSSGIASALISILVKDIAGKMNDPDNKKFNLQSLIKTFTRNDHSSVNIMESIGGMFKK